MPHGAVTLSVIDSYLLPVSECNEIGVCNGTHCNSKQQSTTAIDKNCM